MFGWIGGEHQLRAVAVESDHVEPGFETLSMKDSDSHASIHPSILTPTTRNAEGDDRSHGDETRPESAIGASRVGVLAMPIVTLAGDDNHHAGTADLGRRSRAPDDEPSLEEVERGSSPVSSTGIDANN